MYQRTIEFIRVLRASGVRISIAETQDALRGMDIAGIQDREIFISTLKATLVKEHKDQEVFEHFFPLFFEKNQPPMWDFSQELTPEQQEMLEDALRSLMEDREALRNLLEHLLQGQHLSDEELDQMASQTGIDNAYHMYQQRYFNNQMRRQLDMQLMAQLMDALMDELAAMGMSQEAIDQIMEMMQDNMQAMNEQIDHYVGSNIAKNVAENQRTEPRQNIEDLPFKHLSHEEADMIRDEMRRLAGRLRSRATLRQKHMKTGQLDPRSTIRANLKYGSVPIELKHKQRRVKPRLAIICDLSGSMRHMSEFMLTLTYMLQDLVRRARSFIFISDMVEVTDHFKKSRPDVAVQQVLYENPRGYYTTDLGGSLQTFFQEFLDSVDSKTTVIIVGDGRNNFLNPRLELTEDLQRRARRLLWFCPEPEIMWGTGDSDLHRYAPLSDGVFLVRNLRELGQAIDQILVDG